MTSAHEVWTQLFDFGKHVLASRVDPVTGVITYQIGNAVDATADSDVAEAYCPPGYYALPANPTAGVGGTETCIVKNSDHDAVIGVRDTRDSKIYGNLKPGERCIAGGYPSQNRVLLKANGDTYIYTLLGNADGGQSLVWHQGSDGSFAFQGAAARISADAQGNITIGNSTAGITIGADGTVKIFGTIVQAQASGICQVSGDKMTAVGPIPTLVTPCAIGPSPGVVSTNVMISPVGK